MDKFQAKEKKAYVAYNVYAALIHLNVITASVIEH